MNRIQNLDKESFKMDIDSENDNENGSNFVDKFNLDGIAEISMNFSRESMEHVVKLHISAQIFI